MDHRVASRPGARKSCVALACLALLAGCRFYSQPILEDPLPDPRPTVGVLEQLGAQDVTNFRVIFVHGMGVHEQDYAERWIVEFLAPALGLVEEPGGRTTVPIILAGVAAQPVPPPQLTVYRYRKPGAAGGRDVAFRFNAITWSPLTAAIKQHVATEEDRAHRAYVNKTIKFALLDAALADAVLFAGSYRDVLKNAARQGVCQAMAANPATTVPCTWDTVDVTGMRVAFVTHSLGSRILFDSLNELLARADSRPQLLPVLNRQPSFFMFANQLPLLALADQPALQPAPSPAADVAESQGIPGFSQALVEARGEEFAIGAPVPVNVVAFSDPNDVLSYRLRSGESYSNEGAVRFLNVRISNSPEIPWLAEWPQSAHSGYQLNERVWNVVTSGLPKP